MVIVMSYRVWPNDGVTQCDYCVKTDDWINQPNPNRPDHCKVPHYGECAFFKPRLFKKDQAALDIGHAFLHALEVADSNPTVFLLEAIKRLEEIIAINRMNEMILDKEVT